MSTESVHSNARALVSLRMTDKLAQMRDCGLFSLLLAFALVLMTLPTMAQDERDGNEKLPDTLAEGIDELSEEFPELLDITWAEYTDRDVSMWLPVSYEQTLIESLLDVVDERAAVFGVDLVPLIKAIVNSPDLFRFAAFDLPTMDSGVLSNVIVTREKMLFEFPALEVALAVQTMLPDVMTVILEPEEFEHTLYDAAYTESLTESLLNESLSLQYYIVDGKFLYVVTFTTAVDRHEYDRAISGLIMGTVVIERDEDE